MGWHERAITACATVAVLAGVVSVVAGAAEADRSSPRAADSAGDTAPTARRAPSAYESEVTITLDQPGGSCASFPDADGSGRPHRVCGPVLSCYQRLDGPQGPLGPPTGDERLNRDQPAELGDRAAPFRGGTVYLRTASGELSVGRWYVSSPSSPSLPPEPVPQC